MVTKTYTLWSNQSTLLNAEKKVTVDFFSTVNSASLSWSSSEPFSNITMNGKILSTNKSGQVNVSAQLKNGQVNIVRINYPTGFSSPTVTVTLSVDGYLADFNVIKAQNETFVNAYKTGQIDEAMLRQQMEFQMSIAQNMLANGMITDSQYTQLNNIFINALPSTQQNNNNNNNSGNDTNTNNDADKGFWGSLTSWFSGGSGSGDGKQGFWSAKNLAVGGVVLFVLLLVVAVILGSGGKSK